ncbi:MAG: hypothetical protein WCI74_16610, partial [Actinomycetes bacterium]
QTPAETGVHSRYEDALDDLTTSPDADAGILTAHAVVPTKDAEALTVKLATDAHADYAALVAGYAAAGNSPAVQPITARSLNAAVGGLADVIAGIAVDAGAPRGAVEERGAGSPAQGAATVPGVVWCIAGMVLGAVFFAALAVIVLMRRRRR